MKNLTLLVHAGLEQVLADTLRALPEIPHFIFSTVESHAVQDTHDRSLSAHDRVVGYTPHVRVDILLQDKNIDAVLKALRADDAGIAGRGSYWITEVKDQGRL